MRETATRRYLLDANILAAFLRGRSNTRSLVAPWISRQEAATSILVYGEIIEYLLGFADFARHQAELLVLLQDIPAYPVTYAISERYVRLRRAMRPPSGSGLIGDVDTLIAATAIEHNLTLITTDSDFMHVPDLLYQLFSRDALK